MNGYRRMLDWIYSFTNLEKSRTRYLAQESMQLEKIAWLLERLGNPHHGQRIVHIAGSKGKGSVAFLLACRLTGRGFRTGLYTSPHLLDLRERIRMDGRMIPEEEFFRLAEEIRAIVESVPGKSLEPTFFDIFTAMAFAWYRRREAEWWVVETGLGGRLDSTNVVQPAVSVITSISKEHTELLGRRLREIAREKGGIIKPGTPVAVAGNRPEVMVVLREIARERRAPLHYLPDRLACRPAGYRREPAGRIFQRLAIEGRIVETSLLGLYQAENIGLSLLAWRVLQQSGALPLAAARPPAEPGGAEPPEDLGFLRDLEWPGRLTYRRLDGVELWVDGAHNAESARYLARSLQGLRRSGVTDQRPLVGIVGMFHDKDHAGILKAILPLLEAVYFVEPDSWRDCRAKHYLPVFHRLNARGIPWKALGPVDQRAGWLERVMEESRRRFGGSYGLLATGSLYTAAVALRAVEARPGRGS